MKKSQATEKTAEMPAQKAPKLTRTGRQSKSKTEDRLSPGKIRMSVVVDAHVCESIKKMAKKRHFSASQMVNAMLSDYLQQEQQYTALISDPNMKRLLGEVFTRPDAMRSLASALEIMPQQTGMIENSIFDMLDIKK